MGGKMRIGKHLATIIQGFNPQHYHEPFCGMFSVGKYIKCPVRTANDILPDLILLLKSVQSGWDPPTDIPEKLYKELKNEAPSHLRGFAGFGCSFYGKFFGGFARDPGMRNFAATARDNMLKLAPLIQGVEFKCEPYSEYSGGADVIYCDPPYRGTTDFTDRGFDSDAFWEWARRRSEVVLVSEYEAPSDFMAIWEKPVTVTMKNKTGKGFARIEKLFKRIS
jgi:DNA adenine methylase